jgi:hypothetical protein
MHAQSLLARRREALSALLLPNAFDVAVLCVGSTAVSEVSVSGDGYHLSEIGRHLGADPADVWDWGVVGNKMSVPLAPAGAGAGADQLAPEDLQDQLEVPSGWPPRVAWLGGLGGDERSQKDAFEGRRARSATHPRLSRAFPWCCLRRPS